MRAIKLKVGQPFGLKTKRISDVLLKKLTDLHDGEPVLISEIET